MSIGFRAIHSTIPELNPTNREYKIFPTLDLTYDFARLIARRHVRETGKIVDIYYDVTDTVRSRQILGQTARYRQIKVRVIAQPGSCTHPPEETQSGWYIPAKEWKPVTPQMLADKYWLLTQARPYINLKRPAE